MSKHNKVENGTLRKQPKMVQVATIIPYMLLLAFSMLVLGVIAGWFIHVTMLGDTVQTVSQLKG